jgi:hypothetical protein
VDAIYGYVGNTFLLLKTTQGLLSLAPLAEFSAG